MCHRRGSSLRSGTEGQTIQLLDLPVGPFRPGNNKMVVFVKHKCPRWQQSSKLAIFSIKVTRSLTLVSFERISLVEYACQI